MYTLVLIIYLIVCFALTIVILLQSSKGGGLAGAFGGSGGMGAVFGGRGAATFLSRVTTVLAAAFLSLALLLSFFNRTDSESRGLVGEERQKRSALPGTGLPVVPADETNPSLPVNQPATTASDSAR